MSKFTFICQEESMPFVSSTEAKRTVEFRADGLSDIIQEFECFLRGAGFYFEGHLDIVDEDGESPEWQTEEFETPTTGSWDWTVDQLKKGPITLQDVIKEDTISIPSGGIDMPSYGAAQPTSAFFSGEDTITLTGLNPGKCVVCGLDKTVMKVHNCYDDNCPKGSW